MLLQFEEKRKSKSIFTVHWTIHKYNFLSILKENTFLLNLSLINTAKIIKRSSLLKCQMMPRYLTQVCTFPLTNTQFFIILVSPPILPKMYRLFIINQELLLKQVINELKLHLLRSSESKETDRWEDKYLQHNVVTVRRQRVGGNEHRLMSGSQARFQSGSKPEMNLAR